MKKNIGFWRSWALVVGTMVGSGVFMLPAVLAPYGEYSLWGWVLAGGGTLALALSLSSLAQRLPKAGGPYAYSSAAFGPLPGFLMAWGYWISLWTGVSAVSIAFAGYVGGLVPGGMTSGQELAIALGIIWLLTAVNIKGIKEASIVQLVTTILKLVPLFVVGIGGLMVGDASSIQPANPDNQSPFALAATITMLTMWAFIGVESATVPADDTINPQKTIPRALVFGAITATIVYLVSTYGIMSLIPTESLANSTAPFTDAAKLLMGNAGGWFVGIGALIAIAGALNSLIMFAGQMPFAVAKDGQFPAIFAKTSKGGSPVVSLLLSSGLSSLFVIFNYSGSLVAAFEWIITISALMVVSPYLVCSLADIVLKIRNGDARFWGVLFAVTALLYSAFLIYGSGTEALIDGLIFFALGIPVYYLTKKR